MEMTPLQVVEAVEELYREGKRTDEIAKMFNLSEAEVVLILEDAHLIR